MTHAAHSRYLPLVLGLFLTAITLAAFWQVQHYDFVNFDDYRYVLENERVRSGLKWEGVLWSG